MTIPTSKILRANKSLVALASLKHSSPEQKQSQNVNIVVNNSKPDLLADEGVKVSYNPPDPPPDDDENPYKNLPARDLASAGETVESLKSMVAEKDNVIADLGIIVDLYRNNPLIINKYIVAKLETLQELIRLLANAETVNIELAEPECGCNSAKYQTIKRIYITVNNEIYSLEMAPSLLQFLEQFNISLAFVQL